MKLILPPGWQICLLPEFTRIVMGQSPPSETYNNDGIGLPFFQGKAEFGDLHPTVRKFCSAPNKVAEAGAILLTIRAPVGPTNLADQRCCIGRGLAAIHPLGNVPEKFVLYLLRSREAELSGAGTGTTFASINGDVLNDFQASLPPLNEQRRIVAKIEELFSELDKGIENLKQARAQLAVYRQALLKHAFEGKLTAVWRAAHAHELESAEQLVASIRSERQRRWEEAQIKAFRDSGKQPPKNWRERFRQINAPDVSNLSLLPDSWIWSSLGECFAVEVGATPSRANPSFWNGDIPWVSSGEVQFCHIVETREKITEEGLANSSTQLNPVGSVILNMIGEGKTRGKAGVLKIAACNNQNCAAIWVSETPVPPLFIYDFLLFCYEQTRQLGSGNNQPAMNKSIVEQITFPVPPQREQETILLLLSEQLSVIENLESDIDTNLQKAEALRQSILKKAFAGELVPQDPNDEPAAALLARIRAERTIATKPAPRAVRKATRKTL